MKNHFSRTLLASLVMLYSINSQSITVSGSHTFTVETCDGCKQLCTSHLGMQYSSCTANHGSDVQAGDTETVTATSATNHSNEGSISLSTSSGSSYTCTCQTN